MIFRTLKFALLLFLLSPVALADSSGLSPKAEAAVEATVHKFMKAHGLDGVGLGILSNRRMVYANGFGNVNRYSPVDIASLSKSLTAILAMRLSEQGKLDLDAPVTREFCPECGTHLLSRVPGMPAVLLKVGTLDSPGDFGAPQMAIFLCDNQPFHVVPEGVATFDKGPGS